MSKIEEILNKVKTTNDFQKLTKEELIDYCLAVTFQRNSIQRELDSVKNNLKQICQKLGIFSGGESNE